MWEVAIIEMSYFNIFKPGKIIQICSEICGDTITNNKKLNLLRQFVTVEERSQMVNHEFNNIHYMPVNKQEVNRIEISIKDRNGEIISFGENAVLITLHFRKKGPILL